MKMFHEFHLAISRQKELEAAEAFEAKWLFSEWLASDNIVGYTGEGEAVKWVDDRPVYVPFPKMGMVCSYFYWGPINRALNFFAWIWNDDWDTIPWTVAKKDRGVVVAGITLHD